MIGRKFLIAGASLVAMTVPHMTYAQEAAEPSPAPEAGAAESGGGIADIVVTAQRRAERLQDVPISVAALNSTQLQESGIESVRDLGQVVPSLTVSNAVGFTITYLRGVGSTAIGPGLEPPVSIYLDGVYYASTTSSLFDFSNIERVEVLKGPQGTLFGRNATGGLVQVITRDPGDEFELKAHLGYANYSTISGDLYVGGPVSDTLSADFSLIASGAGDGWGKNITTGEDVYRNEHNVTARSKLVWKPTDATKVTLIGDYTSYENSMNGQRTPEGSLTNPILGPTPVLTSEYDQAGNITPHARNSNWGGSLKVEQDLGFATLSNLAAYRDSDTELEFDVDFTPVPHLDAFNLRDKEKQFSNELQLSSNGRGPLEWQAGIFYFWARGEYAPSGVCFCNPVTNPVLPGTTTRLDSFGVQHTESLAGYAQATYEFLPETNLTIGLRYTYEKRKVRGTTDIYFDGVFAGSTPTAPDSLTFKKPTWRIAFDHRFSPALLVYASYNRGFKSGGFNTQSAGDPSFKPEKLDAYEVGFKSDLLDRRLRLNVSGFYYDYTNIQVQKVRLANTGIINGAAAEIYGADAELVASITDEFTLSANAAWTHARFKEFTDAPIGPVPGTFVPNLPGDASGNDIPKTPNFQGTIIANYKAPLANGSSVTFNVLGTYSSSYALEADNINLQHKFVKVNASISWRSADERYSARLWGNNLTDQHTMNFNSTLPDGSRNASFDAPRTYGITLGYEF